MSDLQDAVLKQCGFDDKEEQQQTLSDVANHGASGGSVGSFVYYSDTVAFFDDNESTILQAFSDQSNDFGTTSAESLASFNGVDFDTQTAELLLMGHCDDEADVQQYKNVMAWWALETVAYELTQ